MALKVGDFFEDLGIPGIAAGVGAIVLAPLLVPAVAKVGKPVAKAVIKGGIVAYEKSRTTFAEAGEAIEDLVAEVKAELAEENGRVSIEPGETSVES